MTTSGKTGPKATTPRAAEGLLADVNDGPPLEELEGDEDWLSTEETERLS